MGNMYLENRIKFPSIATDYVTDGEVNPQITAFYRERAKGGVGLAGICLCPTRLDQGPWLSIYDDSFIPGVKEIVKIFHDNGTKVYAQLIPGYSWAFPGRPVEFVSPSGISITGRVDPPYRLGGPRRGTATARHTLTESEIAQITEAFGDAAKRAREAGFDALEFGTGGQYFIGQFLSPLINKRTDNYGGSLENRMRFCLEIIDSAKKNAGADWTYIIRWGRQFREDGVTVEDLKSTAIMLERAGIAAIDVIAGWHEDPVPMIQSSVPQGKWIYLADEVKQAVNVPVGTGTNIQDVEVAEKALREGKADYVYMARALVADPELPRKAKEGRLKDIRPCINCGRCYESAVVDEVGLSCTVNPQVGREWEYVVEPVPEPKKVFIIGGGPAGLEAARIASLRGHEVTLYDEKRRVGGATLLAGVIDQRIEKFNKYLQRQVKKWPLKEIRLGGKVTRNLLAETGPDVVVVASGGIPPVLDVPGIDGSNVLSGSDIQKLLGGGAIDRGGVGQRLLWRLASLLVRYWYNFDFVRWFLRFPFPFKKRVIIIGGGFAGCEMGEFLLGKGKQITIIEEGSKLGIDIGPVTRWVMMGRLREGNARLETGVQLEAITERGIKVRKNGASLFLEGDTVLLAKGLVANSDQMKNMIGNIADTRFIGDCSEPGKIMEAMKSGFLLGFEV